DAFVLRDCSFRVAAGEHVALVGATGEGKSTCARLLIRAYDVTRGRVLVDGVDVREWDLARLRRRVGTVFQDTVLFAGTVADDVTSSVDPESEWRIREAMQRLLAGRTSITIAHRLSTVQRADRILVLHRGRVHEEGTHAALVRGGGLYARLWELGLAAPDG